MSRNYWLLVFLLPLNSIAAAPGGAPLLRQCCGQMKSLATGLELYACDHSGAYPKQLSELQPAYLESIPGCPFGKTPYRYEGSKLGYSMRCASGKHPIEGPVYSSRWGLDEKTENYLHSAIPKSERPGVDRRECRENLKRVATTLTMWEADHSKAPVELNELVRDQYLGRLPRCRAGKGSAYKYRRRNNGWVVECSGSHRYRYDSQGGLKAD